MPPLNPIFLYSTQWWNYLLFTFVLFTFVHFWMWYFGQWKANGYNSLILIERHNILVWLELIGLHRDGYEHTLTQKLCKTIDVNFELVLQWQILTLQFPDIEKSELFARADFNKITSIPSVHFFLFSVWRMQRN